jgi:hypothetical protein
MPPKNRQGYKTALGDFVRFTFFLRLHQGDRTVEANPLTAT